MTRRPAPLAAACAEARAVTRLAIDLAMAPVDLATQAARERDPLVRAEINAQAAQARQTADALRAARRQPLRFWGEVRHGL